MAHSETGYCIIKWQTTLKNVEQEMVDKLLREKEVQEILSVSRTYLWRLRKQGKIQAVVQGGNRVYYRQSAIKNYIESLPPMTSCSGPYKV